MKAIVVSVSTQQNFWADFFIYYLKELAKYYDNIYIVSKFDVSKDAMDIVSSMTKNVYCNIDGDDFDRWKYGMSIIPNLNMYSDVTFSNDTIYGPFYSIRDIWKKVDDNKVGFWGITEQEQLNENGERHLFVQTYFINMKIQVAQIFATDFMKLYEGGDKEQKLTQYLVELGYNYKVLIPVNRLDNGKKGIPEAYLLTRPLSLVQKFECPFVARYVFLMSNAETQLFSDGLERNSLLNGLRRIYPIEYIYKDQIKQQNMYDLTNNLGLTHLIEEKHLGKFCWVKVAIFVYLYYQNDFEEYINWLQRVPIYIDIYIFTDMEEKQKLLLQKAKRLRHKIVIQLVSARGREWGIFLNEVHEISGHYKYACFLHDKSYHSFEFPIQAISFRNMLWENLLPSADGIMDIISFFEKNKHIGLILPPIVKCGTYFKYFMNFWTVNYENTLELAKRIGIDMNYLRLDKPPISIGGMFWYKVEALNNLYKIKLDHDKFPEEPMGNDGTINHALERILPYVAQDAGYYSAFAIKKEYICLEWMVEMQIIQAMGKRSKSNMNSLYDFECELPVEIIPNM